MIITYSHLDIYKQIILGAPIDYCSGIPTIVYEGITQTLSDSGIINQTLEA